MEELSQASMKIGQAMYGKKDGSGSAAAADEADSKEAEPKEALGELSSLEELFLQLLLAHGRGPLPRCFGGHRRRSRLFSPPRRLPPVRSTPPMIRRRHSRLRRSRR